MRSAILTLIVLGVLVGAFAIFMSLQSPTVPMEKPGARAEKTEPATNPATRNANERTGGPLAQGTEGNAIGQGEDVWMQQYGKVSGELLSEFRAARYDPPVDGVVHVIKPESRFYMDNGQVLVITARDGRIVMPEQTKKSDKMTQIQSQPPTRGTLNEVTLSLIETPDALDSKDQQPTIVCKLPIVAFDNDALRLNTVQTEIDGRIVPADRVPIVVTGKYEFEGEGLIMRWNQRDQRLESLEVAHGKRFRINDTTGFGAMPIGAPAEKVGGRKVGLSRPLTLDGITPIQLADADPALAVPMSAEEKERRRQKRLAAARRAREQATTQKVAAEPVAYLATFADAVTVFEGDTQIGTADQMLASFTFEDEDKTQPTTVPSTQPRHAASTRPATTKPAKVAAAAPTESKPADTKAGDSKAAEQKPIEVRWTGKLTIVPRKFDQSGLRSVKDRSVQFVGTPARLTREGSTVEAASILAASEGNRFSARGSDQLGPVSLKDAAGTKLVSNAIEVVGDIATILGASTAELMVNDEKGQPQKLLASWKDKGVLHLVTNPNGDRTIDAARFEGAVDVQHPQLSLKSDRLALSFDPTNVGKEPVIKAIDATGNVIASISSVNSQQNVTAKTLILLAGPQADGKIAFNRFKAAGDVTLSDEKQKLVAQQVDATFKPVAAEPGKKSEIAIEKLVADGKVIFTGTDGTTAAADVVSIEAAGAIQMITLQGNPAQMADKDSRLSGKLIRLASDGSTASVVGAGTMNGLARAGASAVGASAKEPQPIELTWSDSFDLDANKNWAYASGNVVILSRGADGSIDKATGRRLTIALTEAPKTESSKAADAKTDSKTPSAIGKKVLQSLTLADEVEISSILNASDDATKLLRRVHLFAPGVTVNTLADGSLGVVSIPTAGRMLYEDRRNANAATQEAETSIRGTVAIEWGKSMTYDPATRQVVLDGKVTVVHQEPGEDAMQMTSEKLVAELQDGADPKQQQLKQVRAEGGASFSSKQVRLDATDATYDPTNNRLIARGTDRQPVEVFDQTGVSSGTFEEVWWNLKENRPERMKNVTGAVRR